MNCEEGSVFHRMLDVVCGHGHGIEAATEIFREVSFMITNDTIVFTNLNTCLHILLTIFCLIQSAIESVRMDRR